MVGRAELLRKLARSCTDEMQPEQDARVVPRPSTVWRYGSVNKCAVTPPTVAQPAAVAPEPHPSPLSPPHQLGQPPPSPLPPPPLSLLPLSPTRAATPPTLPSKVQLSSEASWKPKMEAPPGCKCEEKCGRGSQISDHIKSKRVLQTNSDELRPSYISWVSLCNTPLGIRTLAAIHTSYIDSHTIFTLLHVRIPRHTCLANAALPLTKLQSVTAAAIPTESDGYSPSVVDVMRSMEAAVLLELHTGGRGVEERG